MKKLLILLFLFITSIARAQLEGDEVLQLHSGTTSDMNAMSNQQIGHIIHNTTTNTLWHYNGTSWAEIDKDIPTVYPGFFIINSDGSQTITGLPFQPSKITFIAHANVESLNIDSDNDVGNNNNTLQNAFGTMNGFARDNGGSTTQQVIYIGGNGNSINDISRYASSSHCIGLRYGNQNGDDVGKITAALTSFNSDGFTMNVVRSAPASSENIVVLYTAYK